MKLYLAGQWARRSEIAGHAVTLRACGHEVVSRWHDELMGDDAGNDEAAWRRWADADLTDVTKARAFVAFTEPQGTMSRGGRHVEWGLAQAMRAIAPGRYAFVVGPIESQFYALRDAQFGDVHALAGGLARIEADEHDRPREGGR